MNLEVGPLERSDLDAADRVFRLAFGTYLALPDPSSAFGDRDLVRTRWRAGNTQALAARKDGVLVGSNIVTRWGSLGWFGPLTVRPDLWDQGIARALLDATLPIFERWGVTHRGLFTRGHSPKHVSLYQRYGFWPRFLTPIMEKPLTPGSPSATGAYSSTLFSRLDRRQAADSLHECAELTDSLLAGLDLSGEIHSVQNQKMGETVLLYEGASLQGFSICHLGANSEAGSSRGYVKFAAIRPGPGGDMKLAALLSATEALGASAGATRIEAGVNTSHPEAFRLLQDRGYRTDLIGVAMQSPNEAGYHRSELLVIDDWR